MILMKIKLDEATKIIQERIFEFFELLERENLLIKNDKIVSTVFSQRFQRVLSMCTIIIKKDKLRFNKPKFQRYLNQNKEFDIDEIDFLFNLWKDKVYSFFALQELISVMLANMLDSSKLGIDMKKIMLGTTLSCLGNYKDKDGNLVFLKDVLDNIFRVCHRNSVGHDEWWVDFVGNFYFKDEKPITEIKFDAIILSYYVLVAEIGKEYTRRKFPELTKNFLI